MAKKKKKEKKKKVEDVDELDDIQSYSLDSALHSTKSTKTTLQSLMEEAAEGKGFELPKEQGEEKIRPQLSHESKSKIAKAYALEDVPITHRKPSKKRKKIKTQTESKPKVSPTPAKTQPTPTPVKIQPTARSKIKVEASTVPAPGEKLVKVREEPPSTPLDEAKPPLVKKGNIYVKLTEFFEGLLMGYNDRYERWENSISNILSILRKMRKITKKNTDDLVVSINNLYKKIQTDLEIFKVKRDEVEKVAEVDIESMSGKFKRVLGLLELQIKEYQLKRVTDDLIHELSY